MDASCLGCVARELAISPQSYAARRLGQPGPLRELLQRHWPGRAAEGRKAVWAWCVALGLEAPPPVAAAGPPGSPGAATATSTSAATATSSTTAPPSASQR